MVVRVYPPNPPRPKPTDAERIAARFYAIVVIHDRLLARFRGELMGELLFRLMEAAARETLFELRARGVIDDDPIPAVHVDFGWRVDVIDASAGHVLVKIPAWDGDRPAIERLRSMLRGARLLKEFLHDAQFFAGQEQPK